MGGSNICSDSPISAPTGDATLNLGLSQSHGNAITSKTLTTSGSNVTSAF